MPLLRQPITGKRRWRSIGQVLGLYVAASWVVLQVVDVFAQQLFLPGWVFRGALVLLGVGLPILLVTTFVQEGLRSKPRDEATGLTGLLTWRWALLGGVGAFALLAFGSGGFVVSRALGIGPGATLLAAGTLEARDRVVVADFGSATGDTALARVLGEALRIDLAQSRAVRVAEPLFVAEALERMEHTRDTRLDLALASDLAVREGIPAVVGGELGAVGRGFVVTAEVVAPSTGESLVSARETARSEDALLDAIDRVSARLRERIGESLTNVRADPPLERATTSSLEALRLFTRATRMIDVEARNEEAIPLLEEAVRLDTLFAMAWRKLAQAQQNIGYPLSLRAPAYTRAFELRDRLSERERHLAAATYHQMVTRDRREALAAYQAMVDLDPEDHYALGNGSGILRAMGDPARAEVWALRAIQAEPANRFSYNEAIRAQAQQGKFAEAERTLEAMAEALPGLTVAETAAGQLAYALGDWAEAEARFLAARDRNPAVPGNHYRLTWVARMQGRLAEAERFIDDGVEAGLRRGTEERPVLMRALYKAEQDAVVRKDPVRAVRRVEEALAREPLNPDHATDPPYLNLARIFAEAGRTELARSWVEADRRETPAERLNETAVLFTEIRIALGEERWEDAIELAIRHAGGRCTDPCWEVARAYDRAGWTDEAIAHMERAVTMPWYGNERPNAFYRPLFYERLAELYDERGDTDKAREYYVKFAELWAGADEELQPRVRAARARLSELGAGGESSKPSHRRGPSEQPP